MQFIEHLGNMGDFELISFCIPATSPFGCEFGIECQRVADCIEQVFDIVKGYFDRFAVVGRMLFGVN